MFRAVNTELNQSFYSILLDDLSCVTALLESAWKNKGQVGTYRTFKAFPIKPRLRLLAGCTYFLARSYSCDCQRARGRRHRRISTLASEGV